MTTLFCRRVGDVCAAKSPRPAAVVFAGVSGSGKSSLAFGTIAVESAREWQNNYSLYIRNKMPHYERPKVEAISGLTPSIVVDQRSPGASSRSTVGTAVDVAPLLRLLFSSCGTPSAGGSMAYSFNHPLGMCPNCTGLGETLVLKEETIDLRRRFGRGDTFTIKAHNASRANKYVQRAVLNGKPLCSFFFPAKEVLKGGTLELWMGPEPNKQWGCER